MEGKILVVDDSKFNIKILKDILEQEKYNVYSCNNSLMVLQMVEEINPDVILLDIVMPNLDGFEVCKLLKDNYEIKDIPVIMITAKTDSYDIKKALDLGAFDYIKKPIDNIEVVARIKSALKIKFYQDKLKEMAMKDGLTGVYNHATLIDLFDKEYSVQKINRKDISFVMIDLDYFKKVNDTYGHIVGDIVLKMISDILVDSVRSCDIVGRYGGEEFSIVLPNINFQGVLDLCENIRRNIENYDFNIGEEFIKITASIGVCYKSVDESLNIMEMIKKADNALYKAKNNGRNRIEVDIRLREVIQVGEAIL